MGRSGSPAVLFVILTGLTAGPVHAFDNAAAAIALHIAAPTTKNACSLPGLTSQGVNYDDPGTSPDSFYFTYLIVCNGSDSTGVAGLECGIDYPAAIQVYNWNLCGDLEFPSTGWPAAGGGNLVTWDADNNCQSQPSNPLVPYTVIAVAGYFYMGAYGPSQMDVTPRPITGFAKVADCSAREDDLLGFIPSRLGFAGFGGTFGYNSCIIWDPVEESTWSGIKTRFRR